MPIPPPEDSLTSAEASTLNTFAGVSSNEADGVVADQADETKRKRLVALLRLIALGITPP